MRRTISSTVLIFASASALLSQSDKTEVTFAEHIAPIIYDNCVVCHREGGIGPFSFSSYDLVKKRSRQISEVVSSRFMPPWKPDPHFGPKFQGERRLSDEQIALIQRWDDLGAPSGDLAEAPRLPSFPDTWQLGEPDLILEFPEAYQLQAEGTDIYRNFVIPVPLKSAKHVRAIEFLPNSQLVSSSVLAIYIIIMICITSHCPTSKW